MLHEVFQGCAGAGGVVSAPFCRAMLADDSHPSLTWPKFEALAQGAGLTPETCLARVAEQIGEISRADVAAAVSDLVDAATKLQLQRTPEVWPPTKLADWLSGVRMRCAPVRPTVLTDALQALRRAKKPVGAVGAFRDAANSLRRAQSVATALQPKPQSQPAQTAPQRPKVSNVCAETQTNAVVPVPTEDRGVQFEAPRSTCRDSGSQTEAPPADEERTRALEEANAIEARALAALRHGAASAMAGVDQLSQVLARHQHLLVSDVDYRAQASVEASRLRRKEEALEHLRRLEDEERRLTALIADRGRSRSTTWR